MKVVFEGTEEQIKNLKLLVEQGDNDLPKLREDYQTENLWCIEDVQSRYECTDEEASEILECALTNDGIMDSIWFGIAYHAEFILEL